MKDRLAELTAGTDMSSDSELEEVDIENGGEDELDFEQREALAKYHREMDAILKAVDKIHENVETIESRYQISLNDKLQDSDRAIASNDIARLMDQTERTSEAVRKRLRRIAGENKAFRREHPEKVGTLRVRVNTHQGLTRRFMDAMQLFEEYQDKHRSNVKKAMERQLRLMNPQASEEEIQEALRSGCVDDVVDDSPTLAQLPAEEQTRLRNGLADLKSRNNDIKKLEESIIQLHQLFADMQILVEAQGELLNDIEYNIEDTKGKTETGFNELIQARAYQKSATKKKICIGFMIIAVLAAILVPILVKYIPIWFPGTADTISNLPIVGGGGTNSTSSAEDSDASEGVTEGEPEAAPSSVEARDVLKRVGRLYLQVGASARSGNAREKFEEEGVKGSEFRAVGTGRNAVDAWVVGKEVVSRQGATGNEDEMWEKGNVDLSEGDDEKLQGGGGDAMDASIVMQVMNDVTGVGIFAGMEYGPGSGGRKEEKTKEEWESESESAMDIIWEFVKERMVREVDRMWGEEDSRVGEDEDEDDGNYLDVLTLKY